MAEAGTRFVIGRKYAKEYGYNHRVGEMAIVIKWSRNGFVEIRLDASGNTLYIDKEDVLFIQNASYAFLLKEEWE